MKKQYLFLTFLLCSQLLGCQLQTSGEASAHKDNNKYKNMSAITLSNGHEVSNCAEYNIARADHTIMETVNNNIIANEYLKCSLINTKLLVSNDANAVAAQLLALRVRQIPLSIAQLFERKATLREAGFIQQTDTVLWTAEHHNIVIQVKAKTKGPQSRYLVWVSDIISDGSYYAYYPVWIEILPESGLVQLVPVYQSGF